MRELSENPAELQILGSRLASVAAAGAVTDQVSTEFGIRTVAFDADKGFLLNGKPYVIRGTCNHQDHANVGAALPDRLQYFRVAKLKERGFVSPYLRAFVVGRINPLRWIQGDPPPLEEVLKTMRDRAAKFNTDRIKQEDLASAGGAPDDAE